MSALPHCCAGWACSGLHIIDAQVHAWSRVDAPDWFVAGTIKATCLIETLPAAFEMHEFLYELRDHSAGVLRTTFLSWEIGWESVQTVPDARACCPSCATTARVGLGA